MVPWLYISSHFISFGNAGIVHIERVATELLVPSNHVKKMNNVDYHLLTCGSGLCGDSFSWRISPMRGRRILTATHFIDTPVSSQSTVHQKQDA